MKLKGGLFVICSIILLCSGCTKKQELICKKSNDQLESVVDSKYIVKYENDKVKYIIMQEVATLKDEYSLYINTYAQSAKTNASDYNKHDGFTAKSSASKGTVSLTVEATVSKMTEEDKASYNVELSYDDYKKELESYKYGYKCQ